MPCLVTMIGMNPIRQLVDVLTAVETRLAELIAGVLAFQENNDTTQASDVIQTFHADNVCMEFNVIPTNCV